MQCRNCGDPLDPRRVELGYDYCLKEECQHRCLRRVQLAAVGVNKAADYYMRAEEVVTQPAAATATEAEEVSLVEARIVRPAGEKRPRPKTTLERLLAQEADLDAALAQSYKRFRAGEITAREMDRECDQLVEAFNQLVRSENIRFRSMLRRRSNRAR